MARYYFDVCDGDDDFVDDLGIELADMETAIREARRALADMVRDALRDDTRDLLWIAIRDGAQGPVVLTVTLTTITPADRL